ncbi:unnamed protein product, partial [Porites evermanni]
DFSLTTKVVFTFLTSLAFIVSFLGNSMVIYIIRKDQLLKSTTFLLILNMACGDLVTTTVTCPPLIKFLFVGLAWIPGVFGGLLCKLNLYLVLVAFLGCIFSLTGIQIDRFLAVIRPLTHSPWTNWTKVIIPGIWLAAILLPINMWHEIGGKSSSSSGLNISVCYEEQVPLSMGITLGICFLLPFTVMLILYPIIIYHLWTRQVPGEPSALQQQRANRMARKITKMMVAVVLSFFFCWAPQFIFVWIHPLVGQAAATLPIWLLPFILWLQALNSAMNPVLYAIFNESFRLGFKKVIFRSILRRRDEEVMQSARNQIQNIALVRFQNNTGPQR